MDTRHRMTREERLRMRIILASKSPRRRELLESLGIRFEVIVSNADESCTADDPAALVREISVRKAQAGVNLLSDSGEDVSDTLIIASDTVVFCGDEILGKPVDRADAARMMRLLSGRRHSVYSGISVIYGGRVAQDVSITDVGFGEIGEDELRWYLECADYSDKAGAYAVQGEAALFIDGIAGDYFTVVGLPLRRLYMLLRREFGICLTEKQ